MTDAYIAGFCKTAESYGVSPDALVKAAAPQIRFSRPRLSFADRFLLGRSYTPPRPKTPFSTNRMALSRYVAPSLPFSEHARIAANRMARRIDHFFSPITGSHYRRLQAYMDRIPGHYNGWGSRSYLDEAGDVLSGRLSRPYHLDWGVDAKSWARDVVNDNRIARTQRRIDYEAHKNKGIRRNILMGVLAAGGGIGVHRLANSEGSQARDAFNQAQADTSRTEKLDKSLSDVASTGNKINLMDNAGSRTSPIYRGADPYREAMYNGVYSD